MLQSLLSSPLSLVVGLIALTACIFVHELGHFLAALWRGARVPRFSIFGLGKPIVSRKWRGVEWCICWIPFGAYVQVPQLADLGDLEGGDAEDAEPAGPPLGFLDKVVVAVAGPVFNFLFALVLGTVLWIAGQELSADLATTKIGYVSPTLTLSDGRTVASPAAQAGLQPGDTILSIDGKPVRQWQDVLESIVMGSGNVDGARTATFVVERAGQTVRLTLNPELATDEKVRRIGISPYAQPQVYSVEPDSPGAKAGLQPGDRIDTVDGVPIRSFPALADSLRANATRPIVVRIERHGTGLELPFPVGLAADAGAKFGVAFSTETTLVHIDPFTQVAGFVRNTLRTLWSLVNPYSDVGLGHMGGPIGILVNFSHAAQAGVRVVLWMAILINVALGVFNLLPIPVLDGGHIVFATIAKLRGRPLPIEFIAKLQFTFFVLLISLMLYVSMRDVRRLARDSREPAAEKAPEPAPAKP